MLLKSPPEPRSGLRSGFAAHPRLRIVPDLHLRIAAQIHPAVRVRHRLVFDHQFDVAELLLGGRIRPRAVVHQFALLHHPVLREFLALLLQVPLALLPLELHHQVRIQPVPAGQVLPIEDRAKPFRRRRIVRAQRRDREKNQSQRKRESEGRRGVSWGYRMEGSETRARTAPRGSSLGEILPESQRVSHELPATASAEQYFGSYVLENATARFGTA